MDGMDLVEFLRARLDEDERVARGAEQYFRRSWACDAAVKNGVEHMLHHSPARVLAEVEAKRRIIERAAFIGAAARPPADLAQDTTITDGRFRVLDDVLKLLALPYADHPDYRPEWRLDK